MEDEFDRDELTTEGGDTELPRLGTKMIEMDSYDRFIEGAKLASDGARQLAPYFNHDQWDFLAGIFDQVRVKGSMLAGSNRASDATPSQKHFGEPSMLRNDAYSRVYDGLTNLANGALQLATCHRGDTRWSKIAFMAYALRDSAGKLIRNKFSADVSALFGRAI